VPQGDTAVSDTPDRGDTAAGPGKTMFQLIRQGHSFSGRERNCCFLNTGSGFVDVSAVSGVDFPDDGRALATVDWDHDGDLDFWIANRNAPQVRFLRNDWSGGQSWLAFRLEGRSCNRDAIGARVEVFSVQCSARLPPRGASEGGQVFSNEVSATAEMDGRSVGQRRVKSLRAGDGFLSQSSKWIHFGLGDDHDIDRVEVRWPGGELEVFRGLKANRRYRLVQGSGQPEPWEMERQVALLPSRLEVPRRTDRVTLFSVSRLPMPDLEFMSFGSHEMQTLTPVTSMLRPRPILINLWASWCAPCVAELKELAARKAELEAAGVALVSISTDPVSGIRDRGDIEAWRRDVQAAETLVERIGFPFPAGFATERTMDKLQILHDELFDMHLPLPVPTSILIDTKGQLAALYKGPVDLDRVFEDVANLSLAPEAARDRSVPFPGRWHIEPVRSSLFQLTFKFLQKGYLSDALKILKEQPETVSTHRGFYALLGAAGRAVQDKGDTRGAAWFYRESLKRNPEYVDAQLNLAWILATDPDDDLRDGSEAVRLAEQARESGGDGIFASVTLAAAYAEAGRFDEAVRTARSALSEAEQGGDQAAVKAIRNQIAQYKSKKPFRVEEL
jgi:thiol-disulfide isomerase/thioredoxin